jgi:hypothetical protein
VADRVSNGVSMAEERIPMFGLAYQDGAQPRRVWLGLLPVSSRQAGPTSNAASPIITDPDEAGSDPLGDPRIARLKTSVLTPMAVLRQAIADGANLTNAEAAETLLFILADFALTLNENVPAVLAAGGLGASDPAKPLSDKLKGAAFRGTQSWWDALKAVEVHASDILAGAVPNSPPTANLSLTEVQTALGTLADAGAPADEPFPTLVAIFQSALAGAPGSVEEAVAAILPESPKLAPGSGIYYVVRCVYDRPRCERLQPPLVSSRSVPFELSSFFDPDAPARPLRIPLPVDTSPAGLRKFPRNVAFMISDQLRKQMNRVQGVKLADLDDGNIGNEDGGISLGMICSFSIPIITICALILLLVIVFLLNIVFWWLPFFRICLPLRLKA